MAYILCVNPFEKSRRGAPKAMCRHIAIANTSSEQTPTAKAIISGADPLRAESWLKELILARLSGRIVGFDR